ncbi:MFS transporter [Metabacillus sp. GX 13764]|uniref:MFS transporter n=1 Tax=Metabacillus kandeliae TaxID=2900151 RepID=UPI001E526696|nr:MFS transporter [Metabacillus kandeliae]MCD7033092.1 MFS transporter [Metabacillus kandeliae]
MAKFQKVIGDIEINRDLVFLLIIGGLYSLSISLSNTFVNVFLWKQTGEFRDLGIYNLAVVIFQPLTFILAGWTAKKIDRVTVLRLGVLFLSIFYIFVLWIGENASSYLFLLGALLGVGYGFYWLAFNVLTFEITEPETRDFFNGFLGILTSSAGAIGPIAAGAVISRFISDTGYRLIFGLSFCLFASAVLLSLFLKRRPAHGRYMLKRVFSERQHNENWRAITNAHFFQGLREGTFAFIIGVFVFIATGSELALGTFGLVNSGIAFIAYYFVSRLIKKKIRKKSILAGGLILYLSLFLLLFNMSFQSLLLYAVCIAVAYPLLLVPYVSLTYDVIGTSWNAAEARIEYIVVRELFLNAGRIVSLLLFLGAVTFFAQGKSIPILLAIVGAGHALIYPCIRKIHLKEKTDERENKPAMPDSSLLDGDNAT